MVSVGYKSLDPRTLSSPFPGLAVSTPSLYLQVSLHPNPCSRVCAYFFFRIYCIFGCNGSSLRCTASLALLRLSLAVTSRVCSLAAVRGLPVEVAFLAVEHWL